MPITIETIPIKQTSAGNVATPRSLEVTLRFDVTGGKKQMTAGRLTAMLNEIAAKTRAAVEAQEVSVTAVEGTWAWVYGPWFKGTFS